MKPMTTRIEHDYPYAVAGRIWVLPYYEITILPDGTAVVLKEESDRIHRAIANEICGSADHLTVDELDFLCGITATNYTELAAVLELNKSTLSRWKRPGFVPSRATSSLLKRWFWMRLFAAEMASTEVPLSMLDKDDTMLDYLRKRALAEGIAEPVHRKVA